MALGHWLKDYIGPHSGGSGGSGGGGTEPLIVRFDRTEGDRNYYDKTWQEVYDALANAKRVVVLLNADDAILQTIIVNAYYDKNMSSPYRASADENSDFRAETADGYIYKPSSPIGGGGIS